MAQRNLCVQTMTHVTNRYRQANSTLPDSGFIRCKTIPPVRSLADAKKIAYRITRRLDNAKVVSIRLSPKGSEEKGRRYHFVKLHGKIECRVNSPWGPKCD